MLSSAELFLLTVMSFAAPYLCVTLSLNLEYGFGGVPNFGKVIAVAGGAFLAGYLPGRLLAMLYSVGTPSTYISNNSLIIYKITSILSQNIAESIGIFLLTIGAVILFGAFLGLVVAYPVARLRSDYLGMTFLAIGQVVLVIGQNYTPIAGGPLGVRLPDPFAWVANYSIGGLSGGQSEEVVEVLVMMLVAVLVFFYVQRLTSSPLGRTLRAIRDDENSALALGKDVQRKRIMVIIFASAIAAIGGALFGFYASNVVYSAFSRTDWTFWPWIMVILGGAGNNFGVVVGTFIFVSLHDYILTYESNIFNFFHVSSQFQFPAAYLDTLILGLVLIIVLLYRPDGIFKEKPIKTIKGGGPPPTIPAPATAAGVLPADQADQQNQPPKEKPKRTWRSYFVEEKKDKDKGENKDT